VGKRGVKYNILCYTMKCPYCNHTETKVTDKRDSESITRRRRECLKCAKRFTTYERVELDLNVVKKDGNREKFNLNKISEGVEKALEKRPITTERIDDLISKIEARIRRNAKDRDIGSSKIGEIIMAELKKVDKVAYIRFASVYREFADIDDFKQEIRGLK
jgi:transcriptional repressor NrdR